MKKYRYYGIIGMWLTTALILSSFTSPPPSTDRVNQLVADWERAKAFTLEYLDAMPDDGTNYKPSTEVRSFAEQMLHLAMGNAGIVGAATGKERLFKENIEKSDAYKTKAALREAVVQSYDFVLAALRELDDAKLQEKVKFFNGQEYTRETGIAKAFEHQTHHRGQATIYLRMKGITPPAEKLF